jgi:SNF family Na+-dependent transporter
MLAIQGLPIFYLELAIGQRLRKGAIGVWHEVKLKHSHSNTEQVDFFWLSFRFLHFWAVSESHQHLLVSS